MSPQLHAAICSPARKHDTGLLCPPNCALPIPTVPSSSSAKGTLGEWKQRASADSKVLMDTQLHSPECSAPHGLKEQSSRLQQTLSHPLPPTRTFNEELTASVHSTSRVPLNHKWEKCGASILLVPVEGHSRRAEVKDTGELLLTVYPTPWPGKARKEIGAAWDAGGLSPPFLYPIQHAYVTENTSKE